MPFYHFAIDKYAIKRYSFAIKQGKTAERKTSMRKAGNRTMEMSGRMHMCMCMDMCMSMDMCVKLSNEFSALLKNKRP